MGSMRMLMLLRSSMRKKGFAPESMVAVAVVIYQSLNH